MTMCAWNGCMEDPAEVHHPSGASFCQIHLDRYADQWRNLYGDSAHLTQSQRAMVVRGVQGELMSLISRLEVLAGNDRWAQRGIVGPLKAVLNRKDQFDPHGFSLDDWIETLEMQEGGKQ